MNANQIEQAINNLTTDVNIDGVESDEDRAALTRLLNSGGKPGKNSKYIDALERLGGIATIEQIVFKIYEVNHQVVRPGDIRYALKAKAKAAKIFIFEKVRQDGKKVPVYMLPDFKRKMEEANLGMYLSSRKI